jgi:flagellin
MLSIQTNVNSMVAQENLRVNNQFQANTITRLTSGYRINSSADDAAGLGVANKYRSDVAELMQGVRNANDGLSTLQIIDGGLANVSKILDRLKTLATQSASSTFTGNRATLNNEFQSLLGEIDRQAANVGLSTSGQGNAKKIGVYVGGGGTSMDNSKVTVDLSTSADLVTSNGLGLSGTQLNGSSPAAISNFKNLVTNSSGLLSGNATQQVTVRTAGATVTATLQGSVSGVTADNLVQQLNAQIASTGVSASIDQSTGALQFTSANTAFTVSVADDSGTAAGVTTGAAGGAATTAAMYHYDGDGAFATVVDGTTDGQDITVVIGSQTVTATIAEGTATATSAASQLNAALNSYGIQAVVSDDGDDFSLYSTQDFTVASEAVTAGWGAAAGWAATSATDPSASSVTPELAAQAAITAITSAVGKLGVVQGKVGTGQNQLQYAIQLAQSQITSFSAAESRIRDADVAQEAANLTKGQVLQQASIAALAQANSAPQAVLSLLRG